MSDSIAASDECSECEESPPFSGIFKDWNFEGLAMRHSKGYALHIGGGFLGFVDIQADNSKYRPFMVGFTGGEKNRLWREYQREVRRRVLADMGLTDEQD